MFEYYDWVKALHIIAVISWMAALLYLPRIFVYHSNAGINSPEDNIFRVMEKNLIRVIMNPAMIVTLITGLYLAYLYGFKNLGFWFHLKSLLVVFLVIIHHYFIFLFRKFNQGLNKFSHKFFRIINEIPTILMIGIVILVVVKPF